MYNVPPTLKVGRLLPAFALKLYFHPGISMRPSCRMVYVHQCTKCEKRVVVHKLAFIYLYS